MTDPDIYGPHIQYLRDCVVQVADAERQYTKAIARREHAIHAALEAGMTQAEIALATGLSKQRVSNLLKGR